jgi:hypothetical protein
MCLPKAKAQPSTESTGHFDAIDLVRRLEAHQAYCREGYRLHQQKVKEREAAKCLAAEAEHVGQHAMDGATSTLGHRDRIEKGGDASTTIHGTGPDIMIAKLALLRQRDQSRDPRTHRRKSRPSSIKGSTNQTSLDRARRLRGPSYLLRDKPKQIPQQPANTDPCPIKKADRRKETMGGSQPFKIYTQETSGKSRPRPIAMNVLEKAARKSKPTSGNGTYVPKNAALGLAKTTTHGADERSKLSRSLSQDQPSGNGTNRQLSRVTTTQVVNKRLSMPTIRSSWKENLTSEGGSRKCTGAKLVSVDEENGKIEHEKAPANATTQLAADTSANIGPQTSSDDYAEHKEQQRRTLREKISSIRLLGRRVQEEDVVALPEQSTAKPAMSRRRSMLLIFR